MKTSQIKFSVIVGMIATALIIITAQYALADSPVPGTTGHQVTTVVPHPTEDVSNRLTHPWGAYLSIGGDPAPTLAGLNAAYNLTEFLRVHAGFGQISMGTKVTTDGNTIDSHEMTMTTIGAGINAMIPGWSLTPVLGLSYSHVTYDGDGTVSVPANNVYGTVGLDWQSETGFNIGFGLNQGATNGTPSGGYLNLGWFI